MRFATEQVKKFCTENRMAPNIAVRLLLSLF